MVKGICITLPEKTKIIDRSAFAGCTNLETINFPKNLQTIGKDAFLSTSKLNTINIDSENTNFQFDNGVLIGTVNGDIILILSSAISGNTFVVPNGVRVLNGELLSNYTQITSVQIPESVTSLDAAFFDSRITRSKYRW